MPSGRAEDLAPEIQNTKGAEGKEEPQKVAMGKFLTHLTATVLVRGLPA